MWRNKNMWVLMTGVFGAEMGMWLGLVGNLDFLQRHTSSSFEQSCILLTGVVTGFVSGPPIGRLIDSLHKKTALIIGGSIRIAGALSMLLAIGSESIPWMLLSMVFIGIAASFYFPGIQAIIPLLFSHDELAEANAIQMNTMTFARIIGTALAGVLLLTISLKEIYVYSLIGYLILLLSTFFIKVEENTAGKLRNKKAPGNQFREIFPVIRSNKVVLQSLILTFIPYTFIAGFNLIVIEVSTIYHTPSMKGLLYTVEGLSVILTGMFAKYFIKKHQVIRLVLLSCFLIILSQTLLAITAIDWFPYVAFCLFGVAIGLFMPVTATIYQKNVASAMHGRFFSFKRVYETGIGQIALLGIGLCLDLVGLSVLMLILAAVSFLLVVYVAGMLVKSNHLKKYAAEPTWKARDKM